MKKIINAVAVIAFLTVSQAWACPDLKGKYSCKDKEGKETGVTQIDQKDNTGNTIYTFTTTSSNQTSTDDLIVDGKEHDLPAEDNLKDLKYVATCNNKDVVANVTAKIVDDTPKEIGKLEVQTVFNKNEQLQLVSKTTGSVTFNDQVQKIDETETCTLQKE